MTNVEIYTKNWCPFCIRAKRHLDNEGVRYNEIDITADAIGEQQMIKRSGRHTVPQIFIGGHHLGGSDDLLRAEKTGLLTHLLSGHSKNAA